MALTAILLLVTIVPCLAVALRIGVAAARLILGPANASSPTVIIESAEVAIERDESNPYSAPQDASISHVVSRPELSFGHAFVIASAQVALIFLTFFFGAAASFPFIMLMAFGLAIPIVVGLLQLKLRISFGRAILIAAVQYSLAFLVVLIAAGAVRFAVR